MISSSHLQGSVHHHFRFSMLKIITQTTCLQFKRNNFSSNRHSFSDFVLRKFFVSANVSFLLGKSNIWSTLPTLTLPLWEDLSTETVLGKVVVLGITYNVTLMMMMMINLLLSKGKIRGLKQKSVGHVVWRRYVYPLFYDTSANSDANTADVEGDCFDTTYRNLRVESKGDFVGRSVVIY
jgi:hypothetical protein